MIKRAILIEYLFIVFGTTFLAVATNIFFEPHQLVTGGVTGIAIIIWHFFSIPIFVTNLVFNIPLFLFGIKYLGKNFVFRTIFATLYLSVALYYTDFLPKFTGDFILASLFGGVFSGVGLGLVFRSFCTTGGTDLAASIIHNFIKHISVAKILSVLDGVIILLGLFVFGINSVMYAVVAVYVSTKVIDTILEGLAFSKGAFIISEKSDVIADEIITKLSRGVTSLLGRGMYTKAEKNVLLCVVDKKQIVKLKEIVVNCDNNAFVIVTDFREVLGEGFR